MATTTDTLIFELKVKDDASKAFDAWENRLKKMAKDALSIGKNFDAFGGIITKAFSMGLSAVKGFASAAMAALKGFISLTQKVGETVWEFAKDSVKAYQEFQDIQIIAQRTMGLVKETADALGKEMRDLALELRGATAKELMNVAGIAGTLGIKFVEGSDNLKDFVKNVHMLSVATDLSAEKIASNFTKVLTIFGIQSDEIGKQMGVWGTVLNRLGNDFNATQSQILKVGESWAASAASAGIAQEKFWAISAAIASATTKFGTAGGQISQIFSKLTTEGAAWAAALNMDVSLLTDAIRRDPVEALQMVIAQLDKLRDTEPIDVFNARLADMGLVGVKTNEMMKTMVLIQDDIGRALATANHELKTQKTLQKEYEAAVSTLTMLWKSFQNAVQEVYRIVGKPLLEALSKIIAVSVLPLVTEFVKWFRDSEEVQAILTQVGDALERIIVMDIMPLVEDFMKWVTGSEDVEGILANAIPNAITYIEEKISQATNKIEEFFGHIKEGKTVWESFLATFPALKTWEENFKNIWASAQELWESLKRIQEEIKNSGITWKDVFGAVVILVDAVASATSKWEIGIDTVKGTLNDIYMWTLKPFVNLFVTGVKTITALFEDGLTAAIKTAGNEMSQYFKELMSWLGELLAKWKLVKDAIFGAGKEEGGGGLGPNAKTQEEIDEAYKKLQDYKKGIDDATESLKEHEKQGTGNSTWPDAQEAIAQTTESVKTYQQSLRVGTSLIKDMLTQIATSQGIASDWMSQALGDMLEMQRRSGQLTFGLTPPPTQQELQTTSPQTTSPQTTSPQTTSPQTVSPQTQQGEMTVINNFSGMNLVDEGARERISRVITRATGNQLRRTRSEEHTS